MIERIRINGPAETYGASGTLSLVSLAEVQAYMEQTGDAGPFDALIQSLIDSVSATAYGLMHGRFLKRPTAEFEYAITPINNTTVFLHQWPVGTVSLLELGYMLGNTWTTVQTLTSVDYTVDKEKGLLIGYGGFPATQFGVRVNWTGGYTAVPPDAKEACFKYVMTKLIRKRKGRIDATTQSGPTEGYTFEDELPKAARVIFQKYATGIGSLGAVLT